MHLSITLPSIWYENHISCQDLEATGVTFPGIPGVISGHNGQVAWGFTNGFPDVQDLYIEKIRRTEGGGVQAEYNGQWEDVKEVIETIKVKGNQPVTEKVLITRHGPIINSLALDDAGDQPLALRWTALEPDLMIEGIFDMLAANDCKEFHNALRQWTTPVQNVVYADRGSQFLDGPMNMSGQATFHLKICHTYIIQKRVILLLRITSLLAPISQHLSL